MPTSASGLGVPARAAPAVARSPRRGGGERGGSWPGLTDGGGGWQSVASLKFSPDGRRLASCSADTSVKLWSVPEGKLERTLGCEGAGPLKGHEQGISDVAWSRDGKLLCTASDDKTLRLWSAETGECLKVLEGHSHYVMTCMFNHSGTMVVSGSFDETVMLWDVKTGAQLKEMPAHSDPVNCVAFSSDSALIVSCSFDGLCRIWDTDTSQCLKTLVDDANPPVSHVQFTPNDKFILMGTLDSRVRIWDFAQEKLVKVYKDPGFKNENYCLFPSVYQAKGPSIVCGSEDGSIFVWDVGSQQVVQKISGRASKEEAGDGHFNAVLATACHPDLNLLATASLEPDLRIILWEDAGPRGLTHKGVAKD